MVSTGLFFNSLFHAIPFNRNGLSSIEVNSEVYQVKPKNSNEEVNEIKNRR